MLGRPGDPPGDRQGDRLSRRLNGLNTARAKADLSQEHVVVDHEPQQASSRCRASPARGSAGCGPHDPRQASGSLLERQGLPPRRRRQLPAPSTPISHSIGGGTRPDPAQHHRRTGAGASLRSRKSTTATWRSRQVRGNTWEWERHTPPKPLPTSHAQGVQEKAANDLKDVVELIEAIHPDRHRHVRSYSAHGQLCGGYRLETER